MQMEKLFSRVESALTALTASALLSQSCLPAMGSENGKKVAPTVSKSTYVVPPAAKIDSRPLTPVVLKGDVSTTGVFDEFHTAAGFKCSRDAHGVTITEVTNGGEAFKCGLRPGDQVLNVQPNAEYTAVTIRRGSNIYEAHIAKQAPNSDRFTAQTPQFDRTAGTPNGNLNGRASRYACSDGDLQLLSKYEFELIIDRSMSMRLRDCPGQLSR